MTLIGIILFVVFLILPKYVKLIVTIVNIVTPDPIPFIDEIAEVAITIAAMNA